MLHGLGQATDTSTSTGMTIMRPTAASVIYGLVSLASVTLSAYHGYKRHNGSVGWAIGWGIFGAFIPIVAVPMVFIQGVGKRKGR